MDRAASFNNPAGRLYSLLEEYQSHADRGRSISETWQQVLEVEPDRLTTDLARALVVVTDLERAVERHGDPRQQQVVTHWVAKWVEPFFATAHAWNKTPSPGTKLIDSSALNALGGLDSYLSAVAPEAKAMPDGGTIEEFREATRDALAKVGAASDLAPEVKRALSQHLLDLEEALTYLRFGGPKHVEHALRLLRCEVLSQSEETQQTPAVQVVKTVAMRTWLGFVLGGPATEKGLEAWFNVAGMLGG